MNEEELRIEAELDTVEEVVMENTLSSDADAAEMPEVSIEDLLLKSLK